MYKAPGLALALISSSYCMANEYSVPIDYWGEMDNYSMEYEDCHVAWHTRTASFLVSGSGCDKLSSEKLSADAIEEINKSRSEATQSSIAKEIWEAGCLDYKQGMASGDFAAHLNPSKFTSIYPQISHRVKTTLYVDGWNSAKNLDGFLNCRELSEYRIEDFLSGINILSSP